MFYFDLPYGVLDPCPKWDKKLTQDDLVAVLKQVGAVNKNNHFVVGFWVHWKQVHELVKVLETMNYSDITPIYWHKENMTYLGRKGRWTMSCETFITAKNMGSLKPTEFPDYMPLNPRERHNFWDGRVCRPQSVDAQNKIINPTEKPPAFAKWFFEMYCKPGDWVLIAGTGAGGDVRGAIEAKLNVFGVDIDPYQLDELHRQLLTLQADQKNRADKQLKKPNRKKKADAEDDSDSASAPEAVDEGVTCGGCGVKNLKADDLVDCEKCQKPRCNSCLAPGNKLCAYCESETTLK